MAGKNATQFIGKNVQVETTPEEIIIRIDRNKRFGLSSTGKTTIVASTQGNQIVTADGIYIGLNAYVKEQ